MRIPLRFIELGGVNVAGRHELVEVRGLWFLVRSMYTTISEGTVSNPAFITMFRPLLGKPARMTDHHNFHLQTCNRGVSLTMMTVYAWLDWFTSQS